MKRIYSICFIVLLCLFQVTPAFASVATSSNWIPDAGTASPSDWNFFTPFDWDAYETDFGISPFPTRALNVTNTVDLTGVTAFFRYYDMSNVMRWTSVKLDSSGSFTITRPSDYVKPYGLYFCIYPSALPSPGTYSFSLQFGSHTGQTYTGGWIFSRKNNTNAAIQDERKAIAKGSGFDDYSGAFTVSKVINLGSGIAWLEAGAFFDQSRQGIFPVGGDVRINFTKTNASPDYTTAGGPQSSQDIQQNISNSAGQIADNTEAINGTLKELIQHISDQLHALWDQMYNYMHLRLVANDNARTQRIIDRLDEGFDINVEVLDRNFHDLMANDDKNTNQITNGYDNSTFNSANSQLDSSVNQYDQAETGIFDSVKENVTGFTIPDFTSNVQVLTAVGFCSNYLQRLFNAIGLYNLPITVSLVMIFVLMVLGYYRVRS